MKLELSRILTQSREGDKLTRISENNLERRYVDWEWLKIWPEQEATILEF